MAYHNPPSGPVKTDRQIRTEHKREENRARAWNAKTDSEKFWDVAFDELAAFVAGIFR